MSGPDAVVVPEFYKSDYIYYSTLPRMMSTRRRRIIILTALRLREGTWRLPAHSASTQPLPHLGSLV